MPGSDTVTMLTTFRGLAVDAAEQDVVDAADREDSQDRLGRTPYDEVATDGCRLAGSVDQTVQPRRVEVGELCEVDGDGRRPPVHDLLQRGAQRRGVRKVDLAVERDLHPITMGRHRPTQEFHIRLQ